MAKDCLYIGPTPYDEDCEQVGPNTNYVKMRHECRVFIGQLRRIHGPEPEGCRLFIKGEAHDFGTYYEVVCYYDSDDSRCVDYALKCEHTPAHWDDIAREELGL